MTSRRVPARAQPRVAWIAAGAAAAALACAVGGWMLANTLLAEPPAPPAADRTVTAGPVQLKVSTAWRRADQPPAVPGLAAAPAFLPYAGLTTTVSVALVPADHRALVPAKLVAAADGRLPRAERMRIVGLEARAYRGIAAGRSVLDVYAIPTTRGVLTLACTDRSEAAGAPTWCLNGLEQIAVERGQPLKLDDGVAFRMRAPAEFRRLDPVRVRARRALQRAKGPISQRRAAKALERAYADSATRLVPVASDGDPSARVVRTLRQASAAYGLLGDAAAGGNPRAWQHARDAVERAERSLQGLLAATVRP